MFRSTNQPPSFHKVRPGRRYQAPATSTFLFLLPSQEKFFFLLLFSETPKREDLPYSSLAFPSSTLFPRPGISSRKTASPGAVLKPQPPELAPPLPLPVSDLPSSYYFTVRNPPTYLLLLSSPERSIQNSRGHGALVAPDRAPSLLFSFFSGGTTRKLNPPALIYAPRRLDVSLPSF